MNERSTRILEIGMASYSSYHLCRAARKGHQKEVEEILKLHPDIIDCPYKYGETPLHIAVCWGHISIVELLIHAGARLDTTTEYGSRPLHNAAAAGNKSMVKLLLQSGSQFLDSPDKDGKTPLHYAAENGHKSIVCILLQFGSQSLDSPDKNGKTPSQYTATLKQL